MGKAIGGLFGGAKQPQQTPATAPAETVKPDAQVLGNAVNPVDPVGKKSKQTANQRYVPGLAL